VLETPCLAVRVMIYSNGEYIPVIKCIGYKQNHGADPDLLPPHLRLQSICRAGACNNDIRLEIQFFTSVRNVTPAAPRNSTLEPADVVLRAQLLYTDPWTRHRNSQRSQETGHMTHDDQRETER
jgi:hypothetical protein